MKSTKALKVLGTVLQILGAVGGITMAGIEIGEGIGKLKDMNTDQTNDDSVASTTEVEA